MAGHVKPASSSRKMLEHDNVAGGRLSKFADNGTGFKKDGYCSIHEEDPGKHGIAATINESFLKFTTERGNNLEKAGVKPGKWCLCINRWAEAYEAFKEGSLSKEDVPKVHLHATDKKVLNDLSYSQLKEFRAQGEAVSEGSRQGVTINPESSVDTTTREKGISGTRPGSDQHYGKTKDGSSASTTGAYNEMARKGSQ